MKTLYCIARVIEVKEGYGMGHVEKGLPKPRIIKLSMEPNPYTPSFTLDIALAAGLHEGYEVGQRVKVTLARATEEEWVAFQQRTKEPQAVAT